MGVKRSNSGEITQFSAPGVNHLPDARPFKLLLTPQEAADALSLDRSTLYILMAQGQIPSLKIGRSRRIRVKDLEAWIDDRVAA